MISGLFGFSLTRRSILLLLTSCRHSRKSSIIASISLSIPFCTSFSTALIVAMAFELSQSFCSALFVTSSFLGEFCSAFSKIFAPTSLYHSSIHPQAKSTCIRSLIPERLAFLWSDIASPRASLAFSVSQLCV